MLNKCSRPLYPFLFLALPNVLKTPENVLSGDQHTPRPLLWEFLGPGFIKGTLGALQTWDSS